MWKIHIGWARYVNLGKIDKQVSYFFVSGLKKPDNCHSWFKVYRNG